MDIGGGLWVMNGVGALIVIFSLDLLLYLEIREQGVERSRDQSHWSSVAKDRFCLKSVVGR
jgi:hypothetical protein